jgi:hypothetical protein
MLLLSLKQGPSSNGPSAAHMVFAHDFSSVLLKFLMQAVSENFFFYYPAAAVAGRGAFWMPYG